MLLQKNSKLKEVIKLFMDSKVEFNEYQEMKGTLEKEIKNIQTKIKCLKKLIINQNGFDRMSVERSIRGHWECLTNFEKR